MDMKAEWFAYIECWALNNANVREIWLFGSRAEDRARPDSDIDLAITLMPPSGNHDWALGNYVAKGDEWQRELIAALKWDVDLTMLPPGFTGTVKLLWQRGS